MDDVQGDAPVIDAGDVQAVGDPAAANSAATEIDVLTAERDVLAKDYDDAKTALAEANAQLAAMTTERDGLQAQIAAAANQPAAVRQPRAAKVRKAGVMENPVIDDLLAAIGGAELVELVFSDGKREIADIPALSITGNAWAKTVAGLALRLPELTINGPGEGRAGWPLAGYALFLDGKQEGWAGRPDVLQISGGMQLNLRDDVVFSG